jgi:signal transduction histidine kinase
LPVTLRFAHNLNRSLRESIALRVENLVLIDQLRAQTALAERANSAKSRFLAAASHDLRQPMHALNLFVERLKTDALTASQQQTVGRIVRAVDALSGLFDSMLDISRLDAGLVRARPSTSRWPNCWTACAATLRPWQRPRACASRSATVMASPMAIPSLWRAS